ncbi:MAG: hypothetical protein AAGA69_02935, partial [Pseudomonadota bacterium]
AAALLGWGSAAFAAFPPVSEDDLIIVQIRLDRFLLSDSAIGYQTGGETCLLLPDIVSALDFAIDVRPEEASGWFLREENTFEFDLTTGELSISGKKVTYPEGAVLDDFGVPCVNVNEAAKWFPVDFDPDISNAVINVSGRVPLPVEERAARKKRQASLGTSSQTPPSLENAPLPAYQLLGAPTVDISLEVEAGDDGAKLAGDVLATGDVLGLSAEMLTAFDDANGIKGVRGRLGRRNPRGILKNGPLFTQALIGDISTPASRLSARSEAGRGIFLSSRELDRPDEFDRTTLRGELQSGWEVELYRNNILLNFQQSRGDGRYEFVDVPILFGRNSFKLIFYGPQGQVKEVIRDVFVGDSLLKPGQVRFTVGIQEQDIPTFYVKDILDNPATGTWRTGAKVEMGLTKTFTLGSGYSSYVLGTDREDYIDGSLRGSLLGVGVFVDASHQIDAGHALGISLQREIRGANISAGFEEFSDFSSEVAEGAGTDLLVRRGRIRADMTITPDADTSIPLALTASWTERASGRTQMEGSVRNSAAVLGLNLTHEVTGRIQRTPAGQQSASAEGTLLLSRISSFATVRGEASYSLGDNPDLTMLTAASDIRLGEETMLRLNTSYDLRADNHSVGMGMNTRFGAVSAGGFVRYGEESGVTAGVSLSSSLARSPDGNWLNSSRRLAGLGGAMVRAYIDDDADGVYDEGEELLPNVAATVSGRRFDRAIDTATGQLLPGLTAYEPVAIGIDMLTVDDPYLVAAEQKSVALIPRPGAVPVIDLPLVRSGEVVGEITRRTARGIRGVGDAELELVDPEGEVMARTKSEFDGFFVFETVPFGDYRLRLAPEQAGRLDVRLSHEPEVTLSEGHDIVEGISLTLLEDTGLTIEQLILNAAAE